MWKLAVCPPEFADMFQLQKLRSCQNSVRPHATFFGLEFESFCMRVAVCLQKPNLLPLACVHIFTYANAATAQVLTQVQREADLALILKLNCARPGCHSAVGLDFMPQDARND